MKKEISKEKVFDLINVTSLVANSISFFLASKRILKKGSVTKLDILNIFIDGFSVGFSLRELLLPINERMDETIVETNEK